MQTGTLEEAILEALARGRYGHAVCKALLRMWEITYVGHKRQGKADDTKTSFALRMGLSTGWYNNTDPGAVTRTG